MEKIVEKKHRLPENMYKGFNIVAYTICVFDKQKLFTENNAGLIKEFTEILKKTCTDYDVKNWIYVFMPDHVHLLLQGGSPAADIRKMINMFKQRTGRILKEKTNGKYRWQKDYYDHVLRAEEDLGKHVRYIADNPVRKKLIEKREDYGYTGSINYDLNEIIGNM